MTLSVESKIHQVNGISENERDLAKAYLQGAVYCWCKNRKDEWFSLRDLVGGDNYQWSRTPLMPIYIKHEGVAEDAVKEAGKDTGWLLMRVLNDDQRTFESKKEGMVKHYRWVD
ncbi:hypothetical protein LZG37_05355 [Halomonas titanicae]|uniref:hypothetical protein n=1 Tax=Vreelandella titanicae TaxID=664683 RepID=UPI001F3698B4|nr:hypothetical protein [Halomonas titanicae]MCE7517551.1 hypothetical protein [Halomonas titanicae]